MNPEWNNIKKKTKEQNQRKKFNGNKMKKKNKSNICWKERKKERNIWGEKF